MTSTDGKPKTDVKDDSGTPNEPHKPKVTFCASPPLFWVHSTLLFCCFLPPCVFFSGGSRSASAASAHCFPVVFSPYLMICLTFTIPNVFLALFLPPAVFSLADVLVAGGGKKK